MQLSIDKLGKVAVTVEEGYWSIDKDYDKLTIVEAPNNTYKTYISRKPVPAGTVLTDRNYWIPFSSLREEIVLDFNTFVNLWTENLGTTNTSLNNLYDIVYEKEHNLYAAISAIVVGGVALKQDFGDAENFGISQKFLTQVIDNIQDQINDLHGGSVFGVKLTANPILFEEGVETNVQVVAEISGAKASELGLTIGEDTYVESNVNSINKTVALSETTQVSAYAVQSGLRYENQLTIKTSYPIYYGSGIDTSDFVANKVKLNVIKTTPSGTYNVTVRNNADYVYFAVPTTMNISKATMSGFTFPLDSPITTTINNVSYKLYKSSNTYDAGNLTIVIS